MQYSGIAAIDRAKVNVYRVPTKLLLILYDIKLGSF